MLATMNTAMVFRGLLRGNQTDANSARGSGNEKGCLKRCLQRKRKNLILAILLAQIFANSKKVKKQAISEEIACFPQEKVVRQKGFEPPTFWFVAVRNFCTPCKKCRKPMVMNEKVGDFLRFCAAPASTVIYCKQDMLAVLLAAAHKSIWLFVSRFLIVGPAKRDLPSAFCSLDLRGAERMPAAEQGRSGDV